MILTPPVHLLFIRIYTRQLAGVVDTMSRKVFPVLQYDFEVKILPTREQKNQKKNKSTPARPARSHYYKRTRNATE